MFLLNYIFCFYVYCFIGWCIESAIVSFEQKKLVNRGFLRLPMLPLYGSGSMVILLTTYPVRDGNPFWIYIFGLVGSTILEYITAVLMESILKTKYWDYSNEKFNFQGRICVKASLFWGCLSLFLVYVVNPPIYSLSEKFSQTALIITDIVISVVFIADVVWSFKTALDINKALAVMANIKEEANEIKIKLEVMAEEKRENVDLEIEKLKLRSEELKEQFALHTHKLSFFSKNMIRSNPYIISKKFNETLTELKLKLKK